MATVLFVHDHPTQTANDDILVAALTAATHTVTLQSENTTAQTSGFDVVVVSESGSSTSTTQWDTNPMPVVCLETSWNNLRMSSAGATNPNATTQYDLQTHAITAGLPDPLTWRTSSSGNYGVATSSLPSGAVTVATPQGTATHATVAVAAAGAVLTSGTAPARRACTGLGVGSAPAALTADGKTLFVKLVEWAAGLGGGVTVNAATVARTVTIPTPTVSAPSPDATVNPATMSRAVAIAAPTVSDGAVVLPALVGSNSVEQETHGYCAPAIDANGNLYRVTESQLAALNQPRAMKSSDGGATWTEQDAGNRPGTDTGSIGDLESGWVTQEPGFLTFTWQRSYAAYSRFRTSDHPTNPDTWVANTREQVSAAAGSPQNMCHTSPADQAYQWIFFQNGTLPSYLSRTGPGTYGTQANVDTAGMGAYAWLGASNVSHIIYVKSAQLHYKTLTSAGTLQSTSTRVDSNGVNAVAIPHTRPVPYMSGADEIVTCLFTNASGHLKAVNITNGTPGAEQTVTTSPVLIDPGASGGQASVLSADVAGTTVHAIWSDAATGNVMHSEREHGGSWSAPDTLDAPATDAFYVYGRIYDTGAGTVLGYTYAVNFTDDSVDLWYNELPVTVAGADATVSAATVTRTVSVGVPTTRAGATAAPGTVARTVTIGAPTLVAGAGATVSAATVARTVTVGVPALVAGTGVTVTPATVARTVVVGVLAVSAGGSATVTPATVALQAVVPTPSVSAQVAATATPATVAGSVAVGTPTGHAAANVAPATIVRAVTVPAPTVAAATTVAPATVTRTVAIAAPTVTAAAAGVATPATVARTITIGTPTVVANASAAATPATLSRTVTIGPATATITTTAAPPTVTATVAIGTPTGVAAVVLTPVTLTRLIALATPTVSAVIVPEVPPPAYATVGHTNPAVVQNQPRGRMEVSHQ